MTNFIKPPNTKILFLDSFMDDVTKAEDGSQFFHTAIDQNFLEICSDRVTRKTYSILKDPTHEMFCVTSLDKDGHITSKTVFSSLENVTATLNYKDDHPDKIDFQNSKRMTDCDCDVVKDFRRLHAEMLFFQRMHSIYAPQIDYSCQ